MKLKFIIIDDQRQYALFLRKVLESRYPAAEIAVYAPALTGWPAALDFTQFDIIFCAYILEQENEGVVWLERFAKLDNCPPVVILGPSSLATIALTESEQISARFSAAAYLCKSLSHQQDIFAAIDGALKIAAPAPQHRASNEQQIQGAQNAPAQAKQPYVEPKAFAKLPFVAPPKELAVDGYDIKRKIAEGGMSEIYFCIREQTGEPAVLKTISHRGSSAKKLRAAERSHLEFEVISRIKHQNIVRLFDHGEVNNKIYTTMEFFSTGDLKKRMEAGISQQQALSYLLQIADGLNAIHGCGIIHRDLKPANIMFRDDETLAILDFGIAKDITRQMNLTAKGVRMGTPSYMSPEQGNGGYKIDARSDLYALGVMLYEMLTKKRPYMGPAKKVIRAHMNEPIPELPGEFFELQQILDKLMGKFPHDRFDSAYDLRQYIQQHCNFDTTLNFDFNEKGDFMALDANNKARF